jgi:myo-inositol-1-phosphate synthase
MTTPHVNLSDYVPWLEDRKWCYIRLEGTTFGEVPINCEVKLEVWDSSTGVVIDAVRCGNSPLIAAWVSQSAIERGVHRSGPFSRRLPRGQMAALRPGAARRLERIWCWKSAATPDSTPFEMKRRGAARVVGKTSATWLKPASRRSLRGRHRA